MFFDIIKYPLVAKHRAFCCILIKCPYIIPEIGLFHPSFIHPENGYRYYSYYQSAILETILLLRELDVPIEEIQVFMKREKQVDKENDDGKSKCLRQAGHIEEHPQIRSPYHCNVCLYVLLHHG